MSVAEDNRLSALDDVLDEVIAQGSRRSGILGRIADAVTGPPAPQSALEPSVPARALRGR